MAITSLLKEVTDVRRGSNVCDFNGYLEDYLEMIDEGNEFNAVLKSIFEIDPDSRICVNYRMKLNKDVISNQIIRYKDAFKLTDLTVECPIIIYSQHEDQQRGLMLYNQGERNYLLAKGIYFCFTEPGSVFSECKNELVSLANNDSKEIVDIYSKLFTHKAGALQRAYDKNCFNNYEQLRTDVLDLAEEMKAGAAAKIQAVEDPQPIIYKMIEQWFLLKKVIYVQYMVSKELLNTVHEGNIKKQRNQAKLNADSVVFVPYSELWRMKTNTTN